MNEKNRVELEFTFLEFCKKVQSLGFGFDKSCVMDFIYTDTDMPHDIKNRIKLNPFDFINNEKTVLNESDEKSS